MQEEVHDASDAWGSDALLRELDEFLGVESLGNEQVNENGSVSSLRKMLKVYIF